MAGRSKTAAPFLSPRPQLAQVLLVPGAGITAPVGNGGGGTIAEDHGGAQQPLCFVFCTATSIGVVYGVPLAVNLNAARAAAFDLLLVCFAEDVYAFQGGECS